MSSIAFPTAARWCAECTSAKQAPPVNGINRCKRGVRRPKLPATQKGWTAIHKEARRRAAVYYKMKAMQKRRTSVECGLKLGDDAGGCDAKMSFPLVFNFPLRLKPGHVPQLVTRGL